jgi:folate-binding protein YgfZ
VSLPAGLTPLPRFVARVRGERALAFLHDTTTQDLAGLRPGEGALTCVLDAKGGILAEVRALVLAPDEVLLDGEHTGREAILDGLARIAPLSGVTITDAQMPVTATTGLGLDVPEAEHAFVARDGAVMVRTPDGADIVGPLEIDGPERAFADYDAARIADGRARFGVDIAPGTLINETPLLSRAVSFTKGCYPGQESVARVHNLGRIRRHLVAVSYRGADPVVPHALAAPGSRS